MMAQQEGNQWFKVNGEWIQIMDAEELAAAIVVKYNLRTDEDVEAWIEKELARLDLELLLENEMGAVEYADREVDLMDRYPDAEEMLERLKDNYLK